MANPRQRRKVRSSSYKAVHHSRHAKKLLKKQPAIRGPKALQEAWDKHKTVRQNYAALGLAASLNPRTSGGVERVAQDTEARAEAHGDTAMTGTEGAEASKGRNSGKFPEGFGRIMRDENGAVIGMEIEEEDEIPSDAHQEELIEDKASVLAPETLSWVAMGRTAGQETEKTELVQALEKKATSSHVVRFSSKGEVTVLQRLIAKYREDVGAMARDRKLNIDQRTAGELSRAIRKAGGFTKLGTHSS